MSNHYEGLGDKWVSLLADPPKELPEMMVWVLDKGVTRAAWQVSTPKKETVMVVCPQDAELRSAVTMTGKPGETLKPVCVVPFLEGLPNDLTVEEVRPWKTETEAYVAACRNEGANPIWFHEPLYFRDKDALTPGVRHTFKLAALAYGVRRALLDEMTITEGPQYEAFCAEWLAQNPDKTRLDVPQLTASLAGARIMQPGEYFGDYQLRAPIDAVEETTFADQFKVYKLFIRLGLNTENPLDLVVYAPETTCKLTPAVGDEIDALIWLQGRIIDE